MSIAPVVSLHPRSRARGGSTQAKEERRRRGREEKNRLQQAALNLHRKTELEEVLGLFELGKRRPPGFVALEHRARTACVCRPLASPSSMGGLPIYADDEANEDDADLGTQFYARAARRQQTGTSSTGSRSTSTADSTQYHHQYAIQHTAQHPHACCSRKKQSQSSRNSATLASQLNSIMSPPPQYSASQRRRAARTRLRISYRGTWKWLTQKE